MTRKLLIYGSICSPTFIYVHKLRVGTESLRSWLEAVERSSHHRVGEELRDLGEAHSLLGVWVYSTMRKPRQTQVSLETSVFLDGLGAL